MSESYPADLTNFVNVIYVAKTLSEVEAPTLLIEAANNELTSLIQVMGGPAEIQRRLDEAQINEAS